MHPEENSYDEERDFRFGMLADELTAGKVPQSEAFALHMWLSGQVDEQMLDQAIERAVGTQPAAKQIEACAKLERCAISISEQLNFLNQASPLESTMSRIYRAAVLSNSDHCQLPKSKEPTDWCHFREQLRADTALLVEIAALTIAELQERETKKGRPPKNWKNNLLTELVDRLMQIGDGSQEECFALAHAVWNLYFFDDEIETPDAVAKIFARRKKELKLQGH